MKDFDVIVIGGGCSGLWAAVESARNGARTVLIERNSRIGEKILCAEGAGSPGLGQFLEPRPEWISTGIEQAALVKPEGGSVSIKEPGAGYVLDKSAFLSGLSDIAAADGVEIWTGSSARVSGRGNGGRPGEGPGFEVEVIGPAASRKVTCGALVGADGIESKVARDLGIIKGLKPSDVFSCAQHRVEGIDVEPGTVEFHFGSQVAPGGYAWVFPKGESGANLGVGITYRSRPGPAPLNFLERFKEKRCPSARVTGSLCGGVPSRKSPHKAYWKGVFIAGDASGAADPVSGAGIVPGMESGAMAGIAASSLALGGSLAEAEKRFESGIKGIFKDRGLRLAVRKVLTRMSDGELSKMLALTAEYASQEELLHGDPFKLVKFFVKSMPGTFGLVRHLVGA